MSATARRPSRGDNGGSMTPQTIALHASDVRMASQSQAPVLITAAARGRREMYARLVHACSQSGRFGPFVAYEVTGSRAPIQASRTVQYGVEEPSTLRDHFDRAVGGLLFIDDAAALTSAEQAELFSLLQGPHHSPEHVSSRRPVRIIAGASRHLDSERSSGAFYEPLFYRLNVIHIDLFDHIQKGPDAWWPTPGH